ncbi:MAG: chitobiase/beta-hexosaminidase C-terminal domain-containing protein [Geobacteraceae bacterium]|nr:chitobiase/beta-hexosaminidase C-terminal domain-containing protein [Geobacteraceae bacterium]
MKRLVTLFSIICLVLALSSVSFAGKPGGDTTKPVTTASPLGGTFTAPVTVTLTVNEPATTYYTTNGTTPTTASPVYSAPLYFSATTTLKYFSKDTAGNSELVKTQVYTISVGTVHDTLTWTGYSMCSSCHTTQAQNMYQSVHYQWKGSAAEWTTGPSTQGKMDATDGSSALNSYCINIQGNWGPCGACHAGTGAKPVATANPSAAQLASIDCLMCHADATNAPYSRVRNATTGLFEPAAGLNMNLVVQKAGAKPTRKNCLGCHAKAGGGDAVKRGDIALASGTTSDILYDTHMATGNGGNIQCQGCHTFTAHRVAGRGSDIRPQDSTVQMSCITSSCHAVKSSLTTSHTTYDTSHHVGRVACQSCHLPTYAKNAADTAATEATETHRTWVTAEWNATLNRYEPVPTKANNLTPKYAFWNGTSWGNNAFDNAVLDPATGAYKVSRPVGAINDATTKLYPFKYKTATQALANGKIVPIATAKFFATGLYDDAVKDGLVYLGLPSTTPYTTITTDEYQLLNHQIPASAGNVLACADCHENTTRMNLPAMGYALKAAASVVCSQCHAEKTPRPYDRMHSHVEGKGFDCSWCHNFSRPERGLTMP